MLRVFRLALAFLGEHRARAVLTSLAIAAAVGLVIWVSSGYDAILKTYDEYANLALGRYELAVAPIKVNDNATVPSEALKELRSDSAIASADPMWAIHAKVRSTKPPKASLSQAAKPQERGPRPADVGLESGPGSGPGARLPESLLLATDSPEPPFDMLRGQWISGGLEAAVRADAAAYWGVDAGDSLVVECQRTTLELRVAGIVQAPTLMGAGAFAIPILSPSSGELFVSTNTAEKLTGQSAAISLIGVSMNPEADLTKFRFGWAPRLSRYSTPVQFQEAYEIEEALDQAAAAQNVKLQSLAATGVAVLIAALVAMSALNMGVNERVRQYGVLRAITFTRWQIGLLIAMEGLLLGAIGFVGGVAGGWSILKVVERAASRRLYHGAELGATSLTLAAVAAFGGTFLASLVPAFRAMRVRPLEAMAPMQAVAAGRPLAPWLAIPGIVLLAVNPLMTFVFPPDFGTGVSARMTVGFVAMAIGAVLVGPLLVTSVDQCLGPVIAKMFRIDRKLLASQLTSHLWRSTGTAISMAVGLALFIGIQVWGYTMLEGFVPGSWAPDALISFRGPGLPPEHAQEIGEFPGIDGRRCLPIVVEQPRLRDDLTHSATRPSVTRQDNVVLLGIDPLRAFLSDNPLLELEWVEGNAADAVAKLKNGRGCIVPDHFLTETGLKIGDSFTLVPPQDPERSPVYEIAGAVRLPGWHWQTKLTGFRPRTHRAAALVIAGYDSVALDFDLPAATHVWFDYDMPNANPDQIATAAQGLYSRVLGRDVAIDSAAEGEPAVRVMPVERIRDVLRGNATRWIWLISQVPLVAILIAGLGLLNVMLASVRARHWEFGVLRAIGITGPTLVRAVLAEGLLIGCVAALLSLVFGMLAGWCGCGIAQYTSFFGGLHPDLVVPWRPLLVATGFLLMLATTAAAWPAWSVGRRRTLDLLQMPQ
ncbi:Macrolide export ATP-binding/permease protein MacB [Caulifigura coniformis]|uniref:Macrolide export ATP-binding/permease protein MacB n=1 Tax=Caulifigura coniformis TaxID=2527983 RepID=A0A517S924_9PLAN|nr:ABC transporter permease [Caulifigura coniformis]QDT52628.1 Macrolide export ATP-binding/permease protein MacB [Caulifigura coniformis]